jgi:hypothetical protein
VETESGNWAAISAAIGFELLYLGVNVLVLHTPELRAYGRRVALAAVLTAVTFNTLAHYRMKVPAGLEGAALDGLALTLSILTSLPLAGLAYAVSVLLHRLSEDAQAATIPSASSATALSSIPASMPPTTTSHATTTLALASPHASIPPLTEQAHAATASSITAEPASHTCPTCGTPLTLGQYGAAKRYGYCAACKPPHTERQLLSGA